MGGSILGSETLYFFLKDKIKKKFLFFNDIQEDKLKKFKTTYDSVCWRSNWSNC